MCDDVSRSSHPFMVFQRHCMIVIVMNIDALQLVMKYTKNMKHMVEVSRYHKHLKLK